MKNEVARPKVILDGKQAEQELENLTAKAKKFRDAMMEAAAAGDSKGEKRLQQQLKATNTEIRNLKKEAFDVDRVLKNINGASFNELSQAVRKATNDLKKMQQTDPGYGAQKDKVVALKTKMAELSREQSANVPLWSKMADGANKYFNMITLGIASLTGIAFSFAQFIKGMVGLDDALANVQKTTGLTRKEVREMYVDFRSLNTRTPRAELLLLAEEAGRLGITGKKNIMDFVEVANKIKISLGDDLGGNAEQAIKEVGKLTEIYRVGQQYGTDFKTSMEKVGSGLNEVANNSNASAEYLIEYLKRLGGIATQARITAADIMGYASTYDQLGQNVEMAATAQSQVIVDMFTDPAKYARIAKMEVAAFSNLLNTDANEAFIRFLEGLNGNNEGLSVMATKLDGLGIDGARATQALAALSSNTKMLREQQVLANDSMREGTSLQNEYAIKNENLAGSWEKLTVFINSKFINSSFLGFMEKMIGKVAKLTEVVHPLTKAMKEEVAEVNLLTIELTNANTPAERRNEIYAELNRIAPDVVANIDAENVSLSTLRGNLEKYNAEMIKKLALQDSEETLADKRAAAGMAVNARIESEQSLLKFLQSVSEGQKSISGVNAQQIESILLSDIDLRNKYEEINKLFYAGIGAKDTYVSVVRTRREEKEATDAVTESLNEYMKKYELVFGKSGKDKDPGLPKVGDRKTVGNSVFEWNGTEWKVVQNLNTSGGGNGEPVKTDPFSTIDTEGTIEDDWIIAQARKEIEIFAQKKRSQAEWTAFLDKKVQEQMDIKLKELEFDKEIAAAQEELKAVRIDAVGQIAGALSDMFEQGSAAQIAFLAIEKAAAIAQIIFQTGIANAKAVAASPLTLGQPWVSINTISAGASIAAIVAQTIGQISGSKKEGGYSNSGADSEPDGIYHKNEFIASAPAVRNPTVKPILDIINLAQKNGTIATLNLPAVLGSGGRQSGGYSGGSTSSSPPQPYTSPAAPAIPAEDMRKFTEAIDKLMTWEPSIVYETLEKKKQQYDKIVKGGLK